MPEFFEEFVSGHPIWTYCTIRPLAEAMSKGIFQGAALSRRRVYRRSRPPLTAANRS